MSYFSGGLSMFLSMGVSALSNLLCPLKGSAHVLWLWLLLGRWPLDGLSSLFTPRQPRLLCCSDGAADPPLVFSPRTPSSPYCWPEPSVPVPEDGPTMFYGTHFIMSPPAKSKLKRQSQLLSSVLSRTLSYKYRDLDATFSSLGASDDPAELSTQLSAPGVLKVFGDSVCSGTHYKSVLATGTSSARELVKEALERYALSPERAGQYVLCDVVGQAGDAGRPWQAACVRVFGDNEKPLLIQELWKPREGLSRRFELRKRSDVEALAAKDVDTVTAGEAGRRGGGGAGSVLGSRGKACLAWGTVGC